jgi:hypothetical protein
LRDPAAFADGVADFRVFPDVLVNGIAIAVPFVELAAVGLLLSGKCTRQGTLLSVGLALGFAVLFAGVSMTGRTVQCPCFGGGSFSGAPHRPASPGRQFYWERVDGFFAQALRHRPITGRLGAAAR